MKKFLKWGGLTLAVLLVVGFCAFLYNIPPFFLVTPEEYARQVADAAPTVTDIADPAERAIAERGRYIVMRTTASVATRRTATRGPITPSTSRAAR